MKSFFELAIALIILWAVFYYPYWHLIRPTILLRLRYRVLQAQDRLRLLVITKTIGEKNPAYPIIEMRCHACLSVMEEMDFLQLYSLKPDPEQILRAKQDFETIEQSGAEIRAIHTELLHALLGGVLLNSPGLVIPAGVVLVFQFWFGKFKRLLTATELSAWGATYARA